MSNNKNTLCIATWLIVVAALGSYLCNPIFDASLYGNVIRGRWIYNHREVPTSEIWSAIGGGYFSPDASWLFDLVTAGIFSLGHELAMAAFKLVGCVTFLIVAAVIFSREAQNRVVGTAIAALVGVGLFTGFSFGAEPFAWSLFLLLLRQALSFKKGMPYSASLIFAGSVVYVNTHPSAVLLSVLAISLLVIAEGISVRRIALTILLFFLPHFFTPYFGGQAIYVFSSSLRQFFVSTFSHSDPGTIYYYDSGILLILLAAHLLIRRPLAQKETYLGALLAFIAFAWRPFTAEALLLNGLFIAEAWSKCAPEKFREAVTMIGEKLARSPMVMAAWFFLCLVIVNIAAVVRTPVLLALFPQKALLYIKNGNIAGPIIHESWIGPYFYSVFGSPSGETAVKPLLDDRAKRAHPVDVFRNQNFFKANRGWEDYLQDIKPAAVICRKADPIFAVLSRDPAWEKAFETPIQPKGSSDRFLTEYLEWVVLVHRSPG